MWRWLFGSRDDAYREALASYRAVLASQTETIKAQAEQIGGLKATVDMQFRDLATLAASRSPAPPPRPALASPLLERIPTTLEGEPKPKPEPPARRPFQNMAVSGGHLRVAKAPLPTRPPAA